MIREATARSLHLGLNVVDASHYGSENRLFGCHNDANDMAQIARAQGFRAEVWLDDQATSTRVLEGIRATARELRPGDIFALTYAGHGSQAPDRTGDEADGLDETWVLYDRLLLDDEIYAALAEFAQGVRVLIFSDSCHSGTVARKKRYFASYRALSTDLSTIADLRFRTPEEVDLGIRVWREHESLYRDAVSRIPSTPRELVKASVIQFSGCQDNELSADGNGNGLFTSKVKQAWANGAFGNYREFSERIRASMPHSQTPNYLIFGLGVAPFEAQRPFTVDPPSEHLTDKHDLEIVDMTTNGTYNEIDDGNWQQVVVELQRKIPGWTPPPAALAVASKPNGTSRNGSPPPGGVLAPHGPDPARGGPLSPLLSRAPTGAPIVRWFWWGFHIECSSQGLRDFMNAAQPINAIAAAIGPVTGPAAPFVLAAAAFIEVSLGSLQSLDQGNGVYISMSWFLPGVFVPTTVRALRGTSPEVLRGGAYEQAGAVWEREYHGGPFGLRLEDDIYWNLPTGTVREYPIVHLNPPGFGNIYFNHWLSDDPTVGHFRLHVGVAWWGVGRVQIRMMIRDDPGPRATTTLASAPNAGPRPFLQAEL